MLSRSRSALAVLVCPMPTSHMLLMNASLRVSGKNLELMSWRDFLAPPFITESFVATTNRELKSPWKSSELVSARLNAPSSFASLPCTKFATFMNTVRSFTMC